MAAKSTDSGFFPPGLFNRISESLFNAFLSAMEETPLQLANDSASFFIRIMELPTFRCAELVRIWKRDDHWEIVAKINDGLGGYLPGKLIWQFQRVLTKSERKRIAKKLRKVDLWNLPVDGRDLTMRDGTTWLIEVFDSGRYHGIIRNRFEHSSLLAEFVADVFQISGIDDYQAPQPKNFLTSFAKLHEQLQPKKT